MFYYKTWIFNSVAKKNLQRGSNSVKGKFLGKVQSKQPPVGYKNVLNAWFGDVLGWFGNAESQRVKIGWTRVPKIATRCSNWVQTWFLRIWPRNAQCHFWQNLHNPHLKIFGHNWLLEPTDVILFHRSGRYIFFLPWNCNETEYISYSLGS